MMDSCCCAEFLALGVLACFIFRYSNKLIESIHSTAMRIKVKYSITYFENTKKVTVQTDFDARLLEK